MKRTQLKLEVVTPAFSGGASPGAEWRAPAVRGQLRFWFRAIAGGDADQVRETEKIVFGSTETSSALIVRAVGNPTPVAASIGRSQRATDLAAAWRDQSAATVARLKVLRNGDEQPSNPTQYLGYGPFDKGKLQANRTYFGVGTKLALDLIWRRSVPASEEDLLERAVAAWINLGGIGSRSRRGFGSLRCVDCSGRRLCGGSPSTREDLRNVVSAAFGATPGTGTSRWTRVSNGSCVFLAAQPFPSAELALEAAGSWLVAFRRRYGSPGDTRAAIGLDYSWGKDPGQPGSHLPDRAGFGLPLAFERGSVRVMSARRPLPQGKKPEEPRRASPLFVHISRLGEAEYRPVLTYLPAQFLPSGTHLELYKNETVHTPGQPPTPGMDSVIDRFLADLTSKTLVEQVWP
jgi:CRISPR-associated protein Cmr1